MWHLADFSDHNDCLTYGKQYGHFQFNPHTNTNNDSIQTTIQVIENIRRHSNDYATTQLMILVQIMQTCSIMGSNLYTSKTKRGTLKL